MRLFFKTYLIVALVALLGACQPGEKTISVEVSNPLDIDRSVETVQVQLGSLSTSSSDIIVKDVETDKEVLRQLLDMDGDSVFEAVIFQTALKANHSKSFVVQKGKTEIQPTEVRTFARFVPERTDDFTWENDRVAFRVYGPAAQKMVEDGIPGGTYSGGVDCWLKKVDYSIIDKWYKGNAESPGYYHIDHGEGLDNYHVGPSAGLGGTGVMSDGELHLHINYTDYHILTNGPIKTEFELDYEPYEAGDMTIQEKKTVSIDLGNNFTKFVIDVEGTDTLTTGITLHDNLGEVSVNENAAWASYWTPHFGEELGTSIVVDPKYYAGYSKVVSDVKDKSHLLVHLKVIDGKVEYYAGFAWSGSKQFNDKQDWENNLTTFARKINNPLVVELKGKGK